MEWPFHNELEVRSESSGC